MKIQALLIIVLTAAMLPPCANGQDGTSSAASSASSPSQPPTSPQPAQSPPPVPPTAENLSTSAAAANEAKARYSAFASRAEKDGYLKTASLFRALAKSEEISGKRFEQLGAKSAAKPQAPAAGETLENVHDSIGHEARRRDVTLPGFIKKAEEERQPQAAAAFRAALEKSTSHANLLVSAIASPAQWKSPRRKFFICPDSGVVNSKPGPTCPGAADAQKPLIEVD